MLLFSERRQEALVSGARTIPFCAPASQGFWGGITECFSISLCKTGLKAVFRPQERVRPDWVSVQT